MSSEKVENKICQNCKTQFTIDSEDFNFYEKIKVPPPTFCPECRLVRRLLMRNERTLYKRKCDLCNEEKILLYSPKSKYKVYCRDCFFSDNWSGETYNKDYDFPKPFFEQYINLYNDVPRLGIAKQGFIVNSEYVNRASDAKNCYLIFASNNNENCYYGVSYWGSKNCIDCYNIRKCEKCFECINLRNKNYCIFNKQYSKEEYLSKIYEFKIFNKTGVEKIKEKVKSESLKYIVPSIVEQHSVNVSGNWIENSKNINNSFNCDKIEDGGYLFGVSESKDVMDFTYWGNGSELIYETSSLGRQCSSVFFSDDSWDQLTRAEYCTNCFSSSDLFGCVGLRNKSYCILNKQYTKEEYNVLVPKIKEQMLNKPFIDNVGGTIKYGEFFPSNMTPFAYNESAAQEYFPKTKKEALAQGYHWKEPDARNYVPTILPNELPESIKLVNDSILNEIIACAHEGKCKIEFETNYAPDRPEIVYCEKCYQQEVY